MNALNGMHDEGKEDYILDDDFLFKREQNTDFLAKLIGSTETEPGGSVNFDRELMLELFVAMG